jgi:YHS domain-containing protein
MADRRPIALNEDPVCGMTPDIETARTKGLVTEFGGREYVFCGKGCLLEFKDDPEQFLAAGYQPAM